MQNPAVRCDSFDLAIAMATEQKNETIETIEEREVSHEKNAVSVLGLEPRTHGSQVCEKLNDSVDQIDARSAGDSTRFEKWSVLLVDSTGKIQTQLAEQMSFAGAVAFAARRLCGENQQVIVVVPTSEDMA